MDIRQPSNPMAVQVSIKRPTSTQSSRVDLAIAPDSKKGLTSPVIRNNVAYSMATTSQNAKLTSQSVTDNVRQNTLINSTSVKTTPNNISLTEGLSLRTGPGHISALNPLQIAMQSEEHNTQFEAKFNASDQATLPPSSLFQINNSKVNNTSAGFSINANNPVSKPLVNQTVDELSPTAQTDNITESVTHSIDKQSSQIQNENIAQDSQDDERQTEKETSQQQQKIDAIEQEIISELSARDMEVKQHEQAHKAVGGMFAQSPTYTYEKGPDGNRYAVEGEVKIDVSVIEGDPLATYNKMQKVYAAAMAPVQPSSADIKVAAEAVQKMNQAKAELAELRKDKVFSADDNQSINELANTYQQTNDEFQGFQESQLAPYQQAAESQQPSLIQVRFKQEMIESTETDKPLMPIATLAYQSNQADSTNENTHTSLNLTV
ncbi:putative metalloprotease CJM1_0395 family protein [Shewanella gaetbuli]|uniref:SprA-related family protein n=1 Tax=Shewanella gaetbuli TaxID=220752 RepID=A0A9X1ZPA7_9GAMM|nr:putative metalloprotease CJM1_0395 family protein [Shewanella gaetbuli]MCL1143152.1 hypothetical protein [Shewanella gaetbuli]